MLAPATPATRRSPLIRPAALEMSLHASAIVARVAKPSSRAPSSNSKTSRPRAVVRCAARRARDGDDARDRRAFLRDAALSALALATGAARAGDDDSYAGKLSAKEARKAEILAATRAKAKAQAASSAPVSSNDGAQSALSEPTSATMFRTEDPGRGGGAGAPNVATREAADETPAAPATDEKPAGGGSEGGGLFGMFQ